MTDTEIIKALECCTTKGAKCSDCPAFRKVDRSDCKKYFRGAIDLINSQKADTERHAHWNDDFSFKSNAKRVDICSCCKSAIYRDIDSDKYNYCPNCGCRMDEVEK